MRIFTIRSSITIVEGPSTTPDRVSFTKSADEVNDALRTAANGELAGILGFEERPLVSADFMNDTRSGVVDGPSTMVIDDRMVKILTWYDNEYGYAFRMADLAARVAAEL